MYYRIRAGRCTTSLTRELIRCVLDARERRLQVAVLCCDLSKAFDVANHSTLACKLRHYGIAGNAFALLIDLLTHREQVVIDKGNGIRSDPLCTSTGVAQGSSVSNILFSLLLNDLPENVSSGETFLYADDVAVVVCATTPAELERQLNAAAQEVAQWLEWNGLVLNLKKTHYVHFAIPNSKHQKLSVSIGNNNIEQVGCTSFLGFEIDHGLSWGSHIDKLCGKLGAACFALHRLARVVSSDVVRTCYFATVHSLLQYGAELWGRAGDRERAFRMQKRAVRAIARVPRTTSAKPLFISNQILTLPSLVIFQVAMFTRQTLSGFKTIKESGSSTMVTRGADMLAPVAHRLAKSEKSTHVMGPAVYNRLPNHVTAATSLASFKNKLKTWLIQKAFYNFEEFFN